MDLIKYILFFAAVIIIFLCFTRPANRSHNINLAEWETRTKYEGKEIVTEYRYRYPVNGFTMNTMNQDQWSRWSPWQRNKVPLK